MSSRTKSEIESFYKFLERQLPSETLPADDGQTDIAQMNARFLAGSEGQVPEGWKTEGGFSMAGFAEDVAVLQKKKASLYLIDKPNKGGKHQYEDFSEFLTDKGQEMLQEANLMLVSNPVWSLFRPTFDLAKLNTALAETPEEGRKIEGKEAKRVERIRKKVDENKRKALEAEAKAEAKAAEIYIVPSNFNRKRFVEINIDAEIGFETINLPQGITFAKIADGQKPKGHKMKFSNVDAYAEAAATADKLSLLALLKKPKAQWLKTGSPVLAEARALAGRLDVEIDPLPQPEDGGKVTRAQWKEWKKKQQDVVKATDPKPESVKRSEDEDDEAFSAAKKVRKKEIEAWYQKQKSAKLLNKVINKADKAAAKVAKAKAEAKAKACNKSVNAARKAGRIGMKGLFKELGGLKGWFSANKEKTLPALRLKAYVEGLLSAIDAVKNVTNEEIQRFISDKAVKSGDFFATGIANMKDQDIRLVIDEAVEAFNNRPDAGGESSDNEFHHESYNGLAS